MNTKLISKEKTAELLFGDAESPKGELITDTVIITAQEKHLRPVFGKLYDAMCGGSYGSFVEEYVNPPLAMFIYAQLIRNASVETGPLGTLQHKDTYHKPADEETVATITRCMRKDATVLLKTAVSYIEKNPGDFPEYDPKENILNKISTEGNIVV